MRLVAGEEAKIIKWEIIFFRLFIFFSGNWLRALNNFTSITRDNCLFFGFFIHVSRSHIYFCFFIHV